jgi:hypothetical protein
LNAATTERARDIARGLLAKWRDDPVLFAVEVLGLTTWSRQAEIMRAVATHSRVAVKSGHKVGKSTTIAALASCSPVPAHA